MKCSETVYIGLGGNLGDPPTTIQAALAVLRNAPGVYAMRVSSLYRTAPVDAIGPDFCNAVAEMKTDRQAEDLLLLLLRVEQQFGRERSTRNAPRTLDLDLIAFGATRLTASDVTVPHPRAHLRAFVLIPICELNAHVLLGPPQATALAPAGQWKSRLTEAQIKEVAPW